MKQRIEDFKENMWSAFLSVEHGAKINWNKNEESKILSGNIHDNSAEAYYGIGYKDIDLIFHYTEATTGPFHAKIIEVTDNDRLKDLLTDIWVKVNDLPDSPEKDDPQLAAAYKGLHEGWKEVWHVKNFLVALIKTIMTDKEFKYSRPATGAIDVLRLKYAKADDKLDGLEKKFKEEYMKNE